MLRWYALNSKPRQEKLVQRVLATRGIETYLPLWRPPQARIRDGEPCPYFPSYLFALADLKAIGLSVLQYTPGIRRVVFRGDEPAAIEQLIIDNIRRRLSELELGVFDLSGRQLVRGDRVVITGGPFEGYEAIFDRRLSSGERVRVLVDFLQRGTACELESALVEKKVANRF